MTRLYGFIMLLKICVQAGERRGGGETLISRVPSTERTEREGHLVCVERTESLYPPEILLINQSVILIQRKR